ncbi:MAG: rhodanese-like domain-containing protein [Chloroflexi bacterium]|nr:rhodanese-like domain-containing protein [Chloroflexota bacterium]
MKILDVRTPGEFESAHIPGSYNVPLDQLAEHRYEIRAGVDTPIVVVCRSGMRARQAEQLLREADLTQLHVLDGGLAAWESAGLDIRKGRTRWSLERQVRAAAGALALLGGLGSLFVWRPLIAIPTFVGAGLLFAGVTDTCTMGRLLARLPYNRDATCDVASVVAELTGKPPTVRA